MPTATATALAAGLLASVAGATPVAKPRPVVPPDTLPQARPEIGRPSLAARLPLPRPRPGPGRDAGSAFAQAIVGLHGHLKVAKGAFKPLVRPTAGPFSIAPDNATSAAEDRKSVV